MGYVLSRLLRQVWEGSWQQADFLQFNNKLHERGQLEHLRRQAHHAVTLYFRLIRSATVSSGEADGRWPSASGADDRSASPVPRKAENVITPNRQSSGDGLVVGGTAIDGIGDGAKKASDTTVVDGVVGWIGHKRHRVEWAGVPLKWGELGLVL